ARSSAGALGLMQLMPATARQTAKKLGLKHSGSRLSDEAYNITLGSAYLRQMLDRFGSPVLAAAAYNAGPKRVREWLPKAPLPTDIWVDTISIYETREYVRATMAYTAVFDWKFKNDEKRLKHRMPPAIFADMKVVGN
ncbi:MAG: lytic transglycosylase domain-containing protein, partial [Gammaproteobacteria bacterium]